MRPGVRLGIDVGKVRVGLASSDPHGMLATPVATVPRGDGDVARILTESAERGAVEIVVGLPLALSGNDSASTQDARDFAARLAAVTDIPVRLVDERLSTVSATRALQASGRNSKKSRPVIDQVAAVIILQHALDAERTAGRLPGVVVASHEGR
jgi:putative Holliday junction resolvase